MDDAFIHSTKEENMDDLMDLFKVLCKYGLKISPHKCQFFKKKIVYMGLEFQVKNSKVCSTPLKDKYEAIRNLELPQDSQTNKSIFWQGQLLVIIPPQSMMTPDTYLLLTKEIQKI